MVMRVEDIYELSPMQQGMLFDSVTTGDSGLYLVQLDYALVGPLDVAALTTAWREAFERHAVLRTGFHWEGLESPQQVVFAEVALPFERRDWSSRTAAEQERALAAYIAEDRARGVELDRPPLARLALIDCGRSSWHLVWTFHHILMEGWSAARVLEEVRRRYRALVQGTRYEAPVRRPYRDYIAWLLEQDETVAELFWRRELAGFVRPTHLAIDEAPRGLHEPVTRYDGRSIELGAEETRALARFASGHDLTLATVVQGAWGWLLSRYGDSADVVFGSIVSGRSAPLEGIEEMVGLFVNLLPTRVRVDERAETVPWLRRLQAGQVRQREFEHVPLVELREWSDLAPGMPLFESLVVFENWQGSLEVDDWGGGLEQRSVEGHHGSPGYPLTLVVTPGDRLTLGLSYARDRFRPPVVERLLGHLRTLLGRIAATPGGRLGELSLTSEAEREQLIGDRNPPQEGPAPPPIPVLFAEQVARSPDRVAVEGGGERWTYAELAARADRLARRLLARGVDAGDRVAICLDRGPLAVAYLLASLRIGATYVPLDPDYPEERLRFLLDDSEAELLVARRQRGERLGADPDAVLAVGEEAEEAEEPPPLEPPAELERLPAYMIYTSGSTGRPKGVLVGHCSLAHYVVQAARELGIEPGDRVLQFASLGFDTAAEEIFPALVSGATVVTRSDEMIGSARMFFDRCAELGITVLDLPTAYWHVLVEEVAAGSVEVPETIRALILGGESIRPDSLERWLETVGARPWIWNTYGPTEATIVATWARLTAPPEAGRRSSGARRGEDPSGAPVEPTIGRPVEGVEAYVLDERLEPVPIGLPGELCLGGVGLALGYWRRPALTAERFVPHPFARREGERLYRTGDVVRYLEDGRLVYLGRRDRQVKVRGHRVELEEIEAVLRDHPRVREAAVVLRGGDSRNPELVAYVVGREKDAEATDLRAFVERKLPQQMVPFRFVSLAELPLNAHGKVDRDALPEPARPAAVVSHRHADPETEEERLIAAVWSEVLDVERVGRHDNFFDLGGHSLLLMRVLSEIEGRTGVRLRPGELVQPTLAQIARQVAERREGAPTGRLEGLLKRLPRFVRGESA